MTEIRLGPQDAGRTVEVAAGDRLVVALPANSGAGYLWQVESLPDSAAVLEEHYEDPGTAVGGLKDQVFVLEPGDGGTLRLRHTQPWLGENGVAERYEVRVATAPA